MRANSCITCTVASEMNRLENKPCSMHTFTCFSNKMSISEHFAFEHCWIVHTKTIDVQADPLFKQADVISLNETHMVNNEVITTDMLGITNKFVVFNCNHDTTGGGIALAVNKSFCLLQFFSDCSSEILVVQLQQCFKVVLVMYL